MPGSNLILKDMPSTPDVTSVMFDPAVHFVVRLHFTCEHLISCAVEPGLNCSADL